MDLTQLQSESNSVNLHEAVLPPSNKRSSLVIAFVFAFLLSAAYMFWCMNRGWLPQDDGLLAQSALRVLQGQLPHRDFVENYTGGLSYLHALAFHLFGIKLTALRICIFPFFLAAMASVFYIASTLVSPKTAATITLLSAVWTLPLYPAAMPSWYNLFFALFGAAAIFRYLQVNTRRWLFVAGICGGLSFLVKVIAFYYIAGVWLFFLFREQQLNATRDLQDARSLLAYRTVMGTSVLALLAGIMVLIRQRLGSAEFLHFLFPIVAIAAVLLWSESRGCFRGSRARLRTLADMAWPFVVGVVTPVALFLSYFAYHRSLQAFFRGVFALGLDRVTAMDTLHPHGVKFLLYTIPLALLLIRGVWWKSPAGWFRNSIVILLLALLLLNPATAVSDAVWYSASMLTPLVLALGAALLVRRLNLADNLSDLRRQQLMLLLALAALCSLVQFPFAEKIYFNYFAPLTLLALSAVISTKERPAARFMVGAIMIFYLLFGMFRIEPSHIWENWPVLALPRAGNLRVYKPEKYEAVVHLIQQHARNDVLLATPESPALYFLTGLQNPTRNDNNIAAKDLWRAIDTSGVNVIVLNDLVTFPDPDLTPEVMAALAVRFPHSEVVSMYTIRWRE